MNVQRMKLTTELPETAGFNQSVTFQDYDVKTYKRDQRM